jgi:xylulose-5-phosphate/fructose-6-phosphate phosphoketolase
VRGFNEQGTTTTPFDMVVLNEMSRYHLAIEALRRAQRRPAGAPLAGGPLPDDAGPARAYVRDHLEDMPEVRGWTWGAA